MPTESDGAVLNDPNTSTPELPTSGAGRGFHHGAEAKDKDSKDTEIQGNNNNTLHDSKAGNLC